LSDLIQRSTDESRLEYFFNVLCNIEWWEWRTRELMRQ
jgi:hypothetical protein